MGFTLINTLRYCFGVQGASLSVDNPFSLLLPKEKGGEATAQPDLHGDHHGDHHGELLIALRRASWNQGAAVSLQTRSPIFMCWLSVKNLPANARDPGSIPGSGRSPEEGSGNPLQ